MLYLYLYCFFGAFITTRFAKLPVYFFHSNWYKLPARFQKYYLLMIGNSNIPITFNGFHLVSLNLETFMKVQNRTISIIVN